MGPLISMPSYEARKIKAQGVPRVIPDFARSTTCIQRIEPAHFPGTVSALAGHAAYTATYADGTGLRSLQWERRRGSAPIARLKRAVIAIPCRARSNICRDSPKRFGKRSLGSRRNASGVRRGSANLCT